MPQTSKDMVHYLFLFLMLTACGAGGVDVKYPGPQATLNTISVTPATLSIPIGITQQFTATGTYSDNTTRDITASVTWTSDTQSAATISNTGLATAVSVGASAITAAFGGRTGSTTLSITLPTLTRILVTPTNPIYSAGTIGQFLATGYYNNRTTQNLTATATWSSSAPSVATINSTGLAVAVAPGTTTITGASGDVSGTAELMVPTNVPVSLMWDAPTEYTDGSPLNPVLDLQSYNLYYRTASQTYTSTRVIPFTDHTTSPVIASVALAPGTYYFVVTSVTQDNLESDYSNEATRTID